MAVRTALVGGAGSGIGFATAVALHEAGHRVVLAGRHQDSLTAANARITGDRAGTDPALADGPLDSLVCDLADPESAVAAVRRVEDRHGALDVLVVNAGGPPPGRVLEVSAAQWGYALDLLLVGPLAMAGAAMPAMAERGFGRLVFVTSSAVRQPQPGLATSVVLRAGVHAAAKLLSQEYADRGVTVNCVAPGATRTERREQILRSRAEAAGVDVASADAADLATIPANRPGEAWEVAAAVAFLASSTASYVNGTVLAVDGGRTETV